MNQVQGFNLIPGQILQLINVLTNLVGGREAGQTVDQEASLEELGVDPVVGVQSWVDLACVEVLAVPLAQKEGVGADWA